MGDPKASTSNPSNTPDVRLAETALERAVPETSGPHAGDTCFKKRGVSVASAQQRGRKLGPYRILDKLGEGGMGAVYKAFHEHLEKVVAIKVLPFELTRQAEAVARFQREMKAVGKVEHPHIVRAMDAGEVDGIHYLTMEYVEGIDLAHYVKTRGPMSVSNACKVVRQTAHGLAAAHAAGLVHRDIKPSNLLVTKTGQVKILDLGLARLATQSAPAGHELTAAGYTFGTPDYMAPEQWDDAHTVDGRADLYALGCTLCFLLSGRAPFDTADESGAVVKKMQAHLSWSPPDLKSLVPEIPDELGEVFQKLLAKRPEDRIPTASALADAMLPWTRGATSSMTSPSKESGGSDGKSGRTLSNSKEEHSHLEIEFPQTLLGKRLSEHNQSRRKVASSRAWLITAVCGAAIAITLGATLVVLNRGSKSDSSRTGASAITVARADSPPASSQSTTPDQNESNASDGESPAAPTAADLEPPSPTNDPGVAPVPSPELPVEPPPVSDPMPSRPVVVPSGPKTVLVGTQLGMVSTIKEAFALATAGDTIEIATDEPLLISERLVWNLPGRLTIRAAKDNRPVLVAVQEGTEAGTISFEVLRTPGNDETITLSGLTLVDTVPKPITALIATSRSLALHDCVLVRSNPSGVPIWTREGVPDITLERCYLWRRGPVTTADFRAAQVTIRSCLFAGEGGVRLNSAKQQLLCEDTTFVRTNHAWELVVEGAGSVEVKRSLFFGLPQVVTFRQSSSKPTAAGIATARQQLGKYRGIDNNYFECLRLCPNVSANAKADLAAWQTFTNNGEKDPKFINPQFANADLMTQVPEKLFPPAAFALKPTSPLVRARIGCDVSLLPDIPQRAYDLLPEAVRGNLKP